MTGRHVLAIDQGTTNTKVLLFDEAGAVAARAERDAQAELARALADRRADEPGEPGERDRERDGREDREQRGRHTR